MALLASAHATLLAGNTDAANAELDRAEGMSHSADTEVLQVLALMQRGQYQRAVAYAAHAAGAHLDAPQALALHAWLLALGEQRDHAAVQVTSALRRRPGDVDVLALQARLQTLQPNASADLTTTVPAAGSRPGPVPTGASVPVDARMLATGVLLDGRLTVLVPLQAVQGASALWVRSSLGAARSAVLTKQFDDTGLALLTLTEPLTLPPQHLGLLRAPVDAFAGSPGRVIGMLASPDEAAPKAAWPAMNTGFIGRSNASGTQALGIETPPAPQGAPVFDRAGRWIGVVGAAPAKASGDAALGPRLVSLSQLMKALGDSWMSVPQASTAATLTPAEIYERALPVTLQVLVQRQ